jgi:hypothetical protein
MAEPTKAFCCSITLLKSFTLTEDEVKDLLNKDDNEEIEESDWEKASEKYIKIFIKDNDIPNVNDIKIEEAWHS